MYAVITTFPNNAWQIYAEEMIKSFVKYWPAEIPLLIQLDNDLLYDQVGKLIRPQDAIAVGVEKEHADFIARNQDKDDPQNYRKQCVRFCHKVFAIKRAKDAAEKQRKEGNGPRYLIWMDADVITKSVVTMEYLGNCLPREGEAVSFLGRKDWPHSECGWLAFDLDNEGGLFIDVWHGLYTSDEVLKLKETHDSWAFDHVRDSKDAPKATNLTEGKPGMDIWPHSPMAKFSTHHKGPAAKQKLEKPTQKMGNIQIQTRNAIPDQEIRNHIEENQKLIKKWVKPCKAHDEQFIIVSAGPQLWPEDVLEEYNKGKKIIAVKHALKPLKEVGIKPWATILLDPRPHVYDFVENPDTDMIWFVASQVNPKVTTKLLAHGCNVWGYHASVGAGETELINKQPHAIVNGGSATATRGMELLGQKLGCKNFKLYGYDLCYPDKPDLMALDDLGQPKYLELSVGVNDPTVDRKKCFWSEPQLIAQFEELNALIQSGRYNIEAVGDGMIPFIVKSKRGGELRASKLKAKIKKTSYQEMLKWNKSKETNFLTLAQSFLPLSLRRTS